jgi:lipid II:glycine glycyltransferase (peptidoglycan interpeptide bridge formation enzyme)
MGVSLMRTPVLTPYLGPHIFYPSDLKESRRDSYEHETVSELMKLLPQIKEWHLALPPGMKQAGLFKQYKLRTEVQQTFLVSLGDTEINLFTNIKESARRNIKQAEKELTITEDKTSVHKLYEFQENTLAGKGKKLAYNEQMLVELMEACGDHHAGALWVARNRATIEAIVWQVWDDTTNYYLMGGQNPESNGSKAMTLLLWHCIKDSKNKGLTTFDFEGSMDEGVERFFRNFGGKRELYLVLQKNESLIWRIKKQLIG